MINKLFPRLLNSSKDSRVRGPMEMKDAYNVTVTSDFDGGFAAGNVGDADGDEGVIKPAVGNATQALSNAFNIDDIFPNNVAQRRVIGKVEDRKTGVVYFFLFSSRTEEMGVYAWDSENYFGTGTEVWRPIYRTPEFNFNSLTRVVGDIVHVSGGSDVDFRPILYFTDDENEPRKLDVLRCVENGYSPALLNNYQPNSIHDKDVITACPRAPIVPPTFEFFQEAGNRASDFRRVPGVQFAYQCIYVGGEESAISTYSDIAIPEQYLRQGTIQGELNLPQLCRITIDPSPYGVLTISEEVVAFRILVRRGNDGPFYVVDEVDKAGPFGTITTYDFYNDRVLIGITESEEEKQYDNLPRVAQALSVVENRLFFGNYVEGYDEVPVEAEVTPVYLAGATTETSYELTATPVITYLESTNSSTQPQGQYIQQRVAGVAIDTSTVADILPAGTSLNVSITMEPGKNIGLYNVSGGYHNSRITGGVGPSSGYSTVPFFQQFDSLSEYPYSSGFIGAQQNELGEDIFIPARGSGVGVGNPLQWVCTEDGLTGNPLATVSVVLGTSAATPLKIKGGVVTFSVEVQTTTIIENAQANVRLALGAALSGRLDLLPTGFAVVQSNINPNYSYNLGLRAPDPESEPEFMNLQRLGTGALPMNNELAINVNDPSGNEDALDMITPVFRANNAAATTPCGYIIVNEANVGLRLEFQPNQTQDPAGNLILTMEVESLTNTDILTAIPMLTCPDLRVRQWRIYDGATLDQYQITDINFESTLESEYKFSGTPSQTTNAAFFFLGDSDTNRFDQRRRVIGYLRPTGSSQTNVEGSDIYITNQQRRDELNIGGTLPPLQEAAFLASQGTSMYDTEGGFDFMISDSSTHATSYTAIIVNGFPTNINFSDAANYKLVYTGNQHSEGSVSTMMIIGGALMVRSNSYNELSIPFLNGEEPSTFAVESDVMQSLWGPNIDAYERKTLDKVNWRPAPATTNFVGIDGTQYPNAPTGEGENYGGSSNDVWNSIVGGLSETPTLFEGDLTFVLEPENPDEQLQEIETVFNGFLDQTDLSGGYRSFKTSAYHDLGLVYYDDRGRPGNVNILPRVYVAGYSNEERNAPKGRVELQIDLLSDPPEWAHQYQIVYAGNSTYQDFIQYSVGGAFIDEVGDTSTTRNIYVSLNYLQENDQVSYAESFGAVDSNGNKQLYTFSPGDQVRIISFNQNESQVVYPNQVVFDVVDQVLLTGNNDATTEEGRNPLDSGSSQTPLYLRGNFLVLRDNPAATGFSWSSVRAQGNDLQGPQCNWNKRCIVEIVRPRAGADADIRSYKETGLVFNVGRSVTGGAQGTPTGVYHQTPTIYMRNGDVWWRRIPVNIAPYVDNSFGNLIPAATTDADGVDLDVSYQPRFRNRYLEANTFTDTFPGADVDGYGKRKFYSPEAAEVRRESSITYSDANDFSTRRVRFTSFNPFQAPFKDLPNQYGAINALIEFSEYLFVVQQDKCSVVPINRNILSDASGGNQLISSDKIIGKQKFIDGRYGADNNRESVIKVDESVYFAHSQKGEVYRYSGGKIQVISREGMAAFLYDAFQDNINIANMRAVSGYDPLKDEYILSVINLPTIGYTPPNLFAQPSPDTFVFDDSNIGGGGGTSTGVVIGGGPVLTDWDIDYGGPMAGFVEEEVTIGGLPPDGVIPTGTNPTDYVINNAIRIREDIDAILNNTPPDGYRPLSDSSAIDTIIDFQIQAGLSSIAINFDEYIPPHVGEAMGVATYHLLDGTQVGVIYGNQRSLYNLTPAEAQQVAAEMNTTLGTVIPEAYGDYFNQSGVVNLVNLRAWLEVTKHKLQDDIYQAVVDIKRNQEQNMIGYQKAIPDFFDAVQQEINQNQLGDNQTLVSLLGEAQNAYNELDTYFRNVLLQDTEITVEFLDANRPDTVVSGFGAFPVEAFPLGDLQIYQLSTINVLMENIGESVRPLLLLDSIDVSSVLSGLRTSNASLREQVNVLTSQVQNLSAAPVDTSGDTFIPNVTTNQITQSALEAYAGDDGVLTREDVVTKPELTAQIQQIIDLYVGTAVSAATVTPEQHIAIAADIIKGLAIQSGATGEVFNITGNQNIPNADSLALLQNLGNQLNPLDLGQQGGLKDGTFGVSDVLSTLNEFGNPTGFFGADPALSGPKPGLQALYNLAEVADPFSQYLQDVESGLAGTPNQTITELLQDNIVKFILWVKNNENGSAQTATTYSDLEFTHANIIPPPGGYMGALAFYDLLHPDPEQSHAIWDQFFGVGFLASVQAPLTDPASGPYSWLYDPTFTKLNGSYLGSIGIPLFNRFGQTLTQTVSQADVLTIVQNAIANNQ